MTIHVERETRTLPIIRARFGEFFSIVELAAVLDGLDYLVRLLLPTTPQGVQYVITEAHEDEERLLYYPPLGFIPSAGGEVHAELTKEEIDKFVDNGGFRLELVSISYNSPLEFCAALYAGAFSITQVLKVAERLLGLVERWQDIKLKRAKVKQEDALARQMDVKTRLMEEAADYIVDRVHMKPLDADVRRLTNAAKFLELVEQFELVDEEKAS